MHSVKKIGLLGRDIPAQEGITKECDEKLHAVKRYKAHVKPVPGSQPIFCKARKIPLPLRDIIKERVETMVRQGILVRATCWGHKCIRSSLAAKNGALRLCVDLKVHITRKVLYEDYLIQDMETMFNYLHWASYFGKIDLSDAYYQMELDEDARHMYNQHIARIIQDSSVFRNCIESRPKRIKGVVIFQDE